MKRHLFIGFLVAVVAAGFVACATPDSTPTQPTPTSTSTPATTVDGFVGVWSPDTGGGAPLDLGGAENTADTIDATGACRMVEFKIERETDAKAAKIVFAATCANARIRGYGTGALNEGVLTWKAQGLIALASGQKCAFRFVDGNRAERVPEGLKVRYNGTVCDVAVSGTAIVKKKL
jgi:hypothetical protein